METARALKAKAHSLSPLLDALVEYMGKNCPGYLPHAKSAKDAVNGLVPDDHEEAKNGSGPLTVRIGDLPQQKIQDDPSRKDTSLERPDKSRPSVASKSSDAIAKEIPLLPWGIITGFIVLLVVVATWLKLRKSKSTP